MAVHLGHHHVADDQTRMNTVDLCEGLTTVDTAVDVVVAGKFGLQIVAYLLVVLSNDNAVTTHGRLFHRRLHLIFHRLRLFCQRHECLLRRVDLRDDLLRFEMILAERDGDDELTALFQVMGGNRAMVQFHE